MFLLMNISNMELRNEFGFAIGVVRVIILWRIHLKHYSSAENEETPGKEAAVEGDESRPSFGVRFLGSMGVNVDRGE